MNIDKFVILLDTNAMSSLSLYIQTCASFELEFGSAIEVIRDRLEEKLGSRVNEKFLAIEELKKGYKVLKFLKSKKEQFPDEDSLEVYYSALNEIELYNLFVERRLQQELADNLVPMRVRDRYRSLGAQVLFDYQEEIISQWSGVKEAMKREYIKIKMAEEELKSIGEIFGVAKKVMEKVSMGPIDLYIYSCALYVDADVIISSDGEFKTIVNKIENGGKSRISQDRWALIARDIKSECAELLGRSGEDEIILPRCTNDES